MAIDLNRMRRHQRGTKPLRGQARALASNRLRKALIDRRIEPTRGFNGEKVLDGLQPWPEGADLPFCANIDGGAR